LPTKWDTVPNQILTLTALSGELPATVYDRLNGGKEYKRKVIGALKKADLIERHKCDSVAGYRLTNAGKEKLLAENEKRFGYYLIGSTDTNTHRKDPSRRIRLHRNAEIYLFMLNAGVILYRDQKIPVYEYLRDLRPTASTDFTASAVPNTMSYQDIIVPAFYDSREIKDVEDLTQSIRGSRHIGTLYTDNTIFVVYNAEKTLMKWHSRTEGKASNLLYNTFRSKVTGFDARNIRALIIGDTMDMALEMLNSKGGKRRRFFRIDESFNYFHFVPNDENGEMLMEILLDSEIWEATETLFLGDYKPMQFANYNAIDHDGNPILFAYTFDMKQIANFADWTFKNRRHGIIMCFDFQSEALKEYCNEYMHIETMSGKKFRTDFLNKLYDCD